MSRPLLAALALMSVCAAPAAAQTATVMRDCAPFGKRACYYVPAAAMNDPNPAVIVYFRGHTSAYGGIVPADQRVRSAQQAFTYYALGQNADALGMAILVTGSSDQAVPDTDIDALERTVNKTFRRIILASHSGGYVGFKASLPYNRKISRVVMLDNFYFDSTLSKSVADVVSGGATCGGFHTPHTHASYEKDFKPYLTCSIAMRREDEHNTAVNDCLDAFVDDRACP